MCQEFSKETSFFPTSDCLVKPNMAWSGMPLSTQQGDTYERPMLVPAMSMIVAGPSKAGKTVFVSKFVKFTQELMAEEPTEIIWCYSQMQPGYAELRQCLPHIQFLEGIPDLDALKVDKARPKLIIFDDMMSYFEKNPSLETLFITGCHHWNLSCIHIVQNLFFKGLRTARINANYLVLFKNPSDKLQVANLAHHLYPGKSKFFTEAYEMATAQPYTYLLVDLTQTCPEILRLRTNIFPGELMNVFVKK